MRRELIGVGCWIGFLLLGGSLFSIYESTPAVVRISIDRWPDSCNLPVESGKYRLITFLHPLCPCSRATFESLVDLTHSKTCDAQITCIFWIPQSGDKDWLNAPLVEQARRAQNVRLVMDRGGVETARFGARTSGESFLFNPQGKLLLQGGITPRRAVADLQYCTHTLQRAVQNNSRNVICNKTYGCDLVTPGYDR